MDINHKEETPGQTWTVREIIKFPTQTLCFDAIKESIMLRFLLFHTDLRPHSNFQGVLSKTKDGTIMCLCLVSHVYPCQLAHRALVSEEPAVTKWPPAGSPRVRANKIAQEIQLPTAGQDIEQTTAQEDIIHQ